MMSTCYWWVRLLAPLLAIHMNFDLHRINFDHMHHVIKMH